MTTKEITKVEQGEKAMTGFADNKGLEFLQEAMATEYAGMEFQLDRLKFPSAGATVFEVADDEESEAVKEIVGVIVLHHPAYAYYAEAYQGGHQPPDCCSFDGRQGVGNPGGQCRNCHLNQYGSSREGTGKACKNRRMLYVLREGEAFPIMLSVPTGSLKSWQAYAKHHLSKFRKLSEVVTKISLKKAVSSTGITYSQLTFATVRLLEDEEKEAIAKVTEQAKDYASSFMEMAMNPGTDEAAATA